MCGQLLPSLLDHRGLPLLARGQHFVLCAAYLRLHHLELRADEQPNFPAELMALEDAAGLALVLGEDEQLPEFNRGAVPIETLKDFHGAGV
jgi:hypothetical protein